MGKVQGRNVIKSDVFLPLGREWEIGYKQIISYFIAVSASQKYAEQNWPLLQMYFSSKSQVKPKTEKEAN